MKLEPFKKKWESFNWHVQRINGHDMDEIEISIKNAKNNGLNCPNIIIADTIKGKGVSFMEDDNNWHYRIPNAGELAMALEEISK